MISQKSFIKTFFSGEIILVLMAVSLLGYFLVADEYRRFKKESAELREEFVQLQKSSAKNEIENVLDYIDFQKKRAEERARQDIKSRAKAAYEIAWNLYREQKGIKNQEEIEKNIIDALRPIRFNNQRGYFFITRLDGVEMLFADKPELEGRNLIHIRDSHGRFVIRDMIALARNSGEGFYRYTWTKPNKPGDRFDKIAYIIHFEPFGWLIGTGEYLDDVIRDTQEGVLERIAKIKFGKHGFVFAGQWDGLVLAGPEKGSNLFESTDARGVKFLQEYIRSAQAGNGYVQYTLPKSGKGKSDIKISYVAGIPEWKWFVGVDVNLDEVEGFIQHKKGDLGKAILYHVLQILGILGICLAGIVLLTRFFASRIRKDFAIFTNFFSQVATESRPIEPEKVLFSEFSELAKAANRMLAERKKAEGELRVSEERYRRLVENAPLGILTIDPEGRIMDVNANLVTILGSPSKEMTQGINMFTYPLLIQAGISADFRQCLQAGTNGVFETAYRSKWGKETHLRYHLTPIRNQEGDSIGVQAIVEDITQQKDLENQLVRAQKLEAIGTLAGGIAHDFNNILAAILGYTELASFDLPQYSRSRENLNQSIKAIHRAKNLVRQILAFSRQNRQERRPMEIRPVVNEGLKILRASLPATIEIRGEIAVNTGIVEADPTQIHQILMNLCTNAAQSMSEKGGVLEVSLIRKDFLGSSSSAIAGIKEGSYVKLTVADTGCGMAPEVVKKVFDPYFTTKEVGKGTGLGLAIVHGIVEDYGGKVTVASEPGKGSVFEVYLPCMSPTSEPMELEKTDHLPRGARERILLVDDETAIAESVKGILEWLGYEVDGRVSSREALDLFRKRSADYDLVITDMTMPQMNGDELAREILKICPDLPVILCTGFSERVSATKAKAMGIKEFLLKPLAIGDLARAVRRCLAEEKNG